MDAKLAPLWRICKDVRRSILDYSLRNPMPHRVEDLQGYCAIAAANVFLSCRRSRLQCLLRGNIGHVFCTSLVDEDEYVVDLTASQFGPRWLPIEVRKFTNADHLSLGPGPYFWRYTETFRTVTALRKWQVAMDWPEEQLATCLVSR